MRGHGRALFVAILLAVAGALNIIYGIEAISDSKFFTEQTTVVIDDLHTYGWVILILGLIELTGAISLFSGHMYGRVIGLVAATLGAFGALFALGTGTPFWSLGVFAICVICIHGLAVYEEA